MERAGVMSEPKPLASLNGSLLARKGSAKPAMRSQLMQPYAPLGAPSPNESNHLEDLGWNDMGEPHAHGQAEILQLTPAPINPETEAETKAEDEHAAAQLAENAQRIAFGLEDQEPLPKPAVVIQQEEIATRLVEVLAEPEDPAIIEEFEPVLQTKRPKSSKRKSRRSALDDGRRAAFTLRLDSERHLKLRLACTVRNRSAQQIVTEALDRLIEAMPEIEALAAQVKRH